MINLSGETEVLARRLAEVRHVTIEDAVRHALEAQARAAGLLSDSVPFRELAPDTAARKRALMDCIVREVAAMPVLDGRAPQEIMDDLNVL